MKVTKLKRKLGNIPLLELFPEGMENEKLPGIIWYHGWQMHKDIVMSQGILFAAEGYRVIIPDAENHGERRSETSSIPSLTFFQSVQTNLFEFEYIINTYRSKGLITDKIAVGGISMGAFTTFALITHHPEIVLAGTLMGTPNIVNWRNRIQGHAVNADLFLPTTYNELTGWVEKYNLATQPEKAQGTKFYIWHGSEDWRVPFEDIKNFTEENTWLDAQIHFDYGVGHQVTPPITNELRDFFAEHKGLLLD